MPVAFAGLASTFLLAKRRSSFFVAYFTPFIREINEPSAKASTEASRLSLFPGKAGDMAVCRLCSFGAKHSLCLWCFFVFWSGGVLSSTDADPFGILASSGYLEVTMGVGGRTITFCAGYGACVISVNRSKWESRRGWRCFTWCGAGESEIRQ